MLTTEISADAHRQEAVTLSFPKSYLDAPGDNDTPIAKIGLWAEVEVGSSVCSAMRARKVWLNAEVSVAYVFLDQVFENSKAPTEFFYSEGTEVSKEAVFEEAKKVWNRQSTAFQKTAVIPKYVSVFAIREQSDEAVTCVLTTYRYKWDDASQQGDYSSSHLEVWYEDICKILLTPNA